METVVQFWKNAMAGIVSVFNDFMACVESWQLLAAAGVLLLLVVILLGALSSRRRKCRELSQDQMQAEREARHARDEGERRLAETEREMRRALNEKQNEMEAALAQKEQELSEKTLESQQLKECVEELTRFKNEYSQIPDARAEATRIIREARDHAYVVSNRTEMEYAEIIEHANQEAESIRALAQQRLARSHDALKAALARANEIVEEAHAEASRIAQIAYMPGPGLIEAPAQEEEAAAQEEAAQEELFQEETPVQEQAPEQTEEAFDDLVDEIPEIEEI